MFKINETENYIKFEFRHQNQIKNYCKKTKSKKSFSCTNNPFSYSRTQIICTIVHINRHCDALHYVKNLN